KAPQHEAGNLPATKPMAQDVNGRERRKRGHRNQGQRIGEEWNHAGTISWMDSSPERDFSRSSAMMVVSCAPHWRQAPSQDCWSCARFSAYCFCVFESM